MSSRCTWSPVGKIKKNIFNTSLSACLAQNSLLKSYNLPNHATHFKLLELRMSIYFVESSLDTIQTWKENRKKVQVPWCRQGLHKQSKNEKWDLSPESQKSMKYCNSFQLLCTCKNPVVLTVKACRLGIRQENFFNYRYPISKGKRGGGFWPLALRILLDILQNLQRKFYFIGTLIYSITMQ